MFYLFIDGKTRTMGASVSQLENFYREMYMAEDERTVTVKDDDGKETTTPAPMPDNVKIVEYDGYVDPGMLYLDNSGEVKMRVFEVDEAEEAAREKALALKELDTQYAADKRELSSQYLDAAMAGDTDTMTAIKDELAALNAKYDADYAALNE